MSLLLDALKKAEARQGAAPVGENVPTEVLSTRTTDHPSSSNPLELTALESQPIPQPTNLKSSEPIAPRMQSTAPRTQPPSQQQTQQQQIQQQARALLNRGGGRGGAGGRSTANPLTGKFDLLAEYLTFPVVVTIVVVVGMVWGGWVLYRSYTYMPSAVSVPMVNAAPAASSAASSTPAATAAPTSVTTTSGNVVLSSPREILPEPLSPNVARRVESGVPLVSSPTVPARTAKTLTETSAEMPTETPAAKQMALQNFASARPANIAPSMAPSNVARPLALNRGERSNGTLSDTLAGAYQALQQGDRETATRQYQQALQLDANNLDALLGLGYLAQQGGAPVRAEHYFKRALQIDPRNAYALSALASLSSQTGASGQGDGDAAGFERRLKTQSALASEMSPDAAALQFALGNTLAAQQRWDEAQQAYFKAVAGDARNPNYLFNLAISLDQLHQSRLALEYYRKALALMNAPAASAPAQFNREQAQQRASALERALSTPIATGQPGSSQP